MAMVFAFLHCYENSTLVVFWACTHKVTIFVIIVTLNYIMALLVATTTTTTSILFTHKCIIFKNAVIDFKWVLTT